MFYICNNSTSHVYLLLLKNKHHNDLAWIISYPFLTLPPSFTRNIYVIYTYLLTLTFTHPNTRLQSTLSRQAPPPPPLSRKGALRAVSTVSSINAPLNRETRRGWLERVRWTRRAITVTHPSRQALPQYSPFGRKFGNSPNTCG